MRIRWTPPAVADLESINTYLKEHYPQYREPIGGGAGAFLATWKFNTSYPLFPFLMLLGPRFGTIKLSYNQPGLHGDI